MLLNAAIHVRGRPLITSLGRRVDLLTPSCFYVFFCLIKSDHFNSNFLFLTSPIFIGSTSLLAAMPLFILKCVFFVNVQNAIGRIVPIHNSAIRSVKVFNRYIVVDLVLQMK